MSARSYGGPGGFSGPGGFGYLRAQTQALALGVELSHNGRRRTLPQLKDAIADHMLLETLRAQARKLGIALSRDGKKCTVSQLATAINYMNSKDRATASNRVRLAHCVLSHRMLMPRNHVADEASTLEAARTHARELGIASWQQGTLQQLIVAIVYHTGKK